MNIGEKKGDEMINFVIQNVSKNGKPNPENQGYEASARRGLEAAGMHPGKAEWTISRSRRISPRLVLTFTAGPAGMVCEWDPQLPAHGDFTKQERKGYEALRNEVTQELTQRLGGAGLMFV